MVISALTFQRPEGQGEPQTIYSEPWGDMPELDVELVFHQP